MTGPAALRFQDIEAGRKADIARALSAIEARDGTLIHADLLDEAAKRARAHSIGLTGPPGVGKSTLTNALVHAWRARGVSVAVVAVDPSSRLTGGALLGDRTRISTDPDDTGVFVRSFAARDRLGGLSDHAVAAIRLLGAFYDRVLVESVGIGQSESDLAFAVDTTLLCVQPGSGDSLQFMKAGIMELPDIVLVTKSDMGRDARRALADVEGALSLAAPTRRGGEAVGANEGGGDEGGADQGGADEGGVRVLLVSAASREGVDDVLAACEAHWTVLAADGRLAAKRAGQDRYWLRDAVRRHYGAAGLRLLQGDGELPPATGLYRSIAEALQSLDVRLR